MWFAIATDEDEDEDGEEGGGFLTSIVRVRARLVANSNSTVS